MPDLDQFLDTLVADVTAGTRALGAPAAIKQARRRRAELAVAAVGAAAVIAVGGGLAAGTSGGSDHPSPAVDPTTSLPTTVQESAETSPTSSEALASELHAIVTGVPGWTITVYSAVTGYDNAFNGPCSGNWGKGATSGNDGGVVGWTDDKRAAGIGMRGFASEAQASDAAARLVANLESCTATAWRTQPIAQPRAVLASTARGVAWIQQTNERVWVLELSTTDGPPPAGVQVEVAEWIVAYSKLQDRK